MWKGTEEVGQSWRLVEAEMKQEDDGRFPSVLVDGRWGSPEDSSSAAHSSSSIIIIIIIIIFSAELKGVGAGEVGSVLIKRLFFFPSPDSPMRPTSPR